jgi:hypothetical protein
VGAGGYAFGEGAECGVAGDAFGSFPGVPASSGVDLDGWRVAVEALLEEPVGCRRPGVEAVLPLLLALLFVGDPLAGPLEVPFLYAFEEAEHGESRRTGIVHTFDSRR